MPNWGSQGFALVYDVTKRSTMEDLEAIKELVWKIKKATKKNPPPIILIGNKTDMPGREVGSRSQCVSSPCSMFRKGADGSWSRQSEGVESDVC